MRIASTLAGVLLTGALLGAPAAMLAQGPPTPREATTSSPAYYQGGWDAPPGSYTRDLQRNAFHDGLYGAEQDLKNHRQPNVRNRDEFPQLPWTGARSVSPGLPARLQQLLESLPGRPRLPRLLNAVQDNSRPGHRWPGSRCLSDTDSFGAARYRTASAGPAAL